MLKDQLRKDNSFSIANSPYNLKQSKEEFGEIQQFTDRELSDIQQENSDDNGGGAEGETISIIASVNNP